MTKFRVNSNFEVLGGFWRPESPNSLITGTLFAVDGKVELLASPSLRFLTPAEVFALINQTENRESDASQVDVLYGRTKEGECTLFWSDRRPYQQVLDGKDGALLEAIRYKASATLMGCHIPSPQADLIERAELTLTGLTGWVPPPLTISSNEKEVIYSQPNSGMKLFDCFTSGLEAQISFEVLSSGHVGLHNGVRLRSVPKLTIAPRKPRSVKWFMDVSHRVENFFSLLVGTSIALKSVQLFQGERSGWIVIHEKRNTEKTNMQLWVRCEAQTLGVALEKWMNVPDDESSVERTFLVMLRKSSLFVRTEFLSLAQSLEAYGRLRFSDSIIPKAEFRTVSKEVEALVEEICGNTMIRKRICESIGHANEITYAMRIKNTIGLLSEEFATQLIEDREAFTRNIVETRNFFTHLGIRKSKNVITDTKDLFMLNQKLHSVLRCVLLLDLGFPENALHAPILYQASRWS